MPDKSVAEKMLIKPRARLLFVNPPENILELLGNLPSGVEIISADTSTQPDLVLAFIANQAELENLLLPLKARLAREGILWLAYHKQTSQVKTDINRDTLWRYVEPFGLSPTRQIAIDEDWSALRFKVAAW
jgi:hypothetical protein